MSNKYLTLGILLLIACFSSVYAQSKKEQQSMDLLTRSMTRQKLIPYKDASQKYGYMDSITRTIVVPAKYDQAGRFSNGMAIIGLGDKYGFVREDGKIITPKYDLITIFREGLSAVFMGSVTKNAKGDVTSFKGLWGYINKSGDEVVGLKYTVALPFYDGLGLVTSDNRTGFINKSGEMAIPMIYQDGQSFKNGMARVKQNNQWIYINVLGETITDTLSTENLPTYYQHIGQVIKLGNTDEISKYLSRGIDLNKKYNDYYPIEYVFQRRKPDMFTVLKLLIDKGSDVNATLSYDNPLIIEVGRYGYNDLDKIEALKLLLEKHVNVNATNSAQNTLLHICCSDNESEEILSIVKLLIENGADLSLENKNEMTPLQIAKKFKRNVIADMIKKAQKK